jgi:hypothetical protein
MATPQSPRPNNVAEKVDATHQALAFEIPMGENRPVGVRRLQSGATTKPLPLSNGETAFAQMPPKQKDFVKLNMETLTMKPPSPQRRSSSARSLHKRGEVPK